MEIIQTKTKQFRPPLYRPTPTCGTVKKVQCGKGRYVQPPRVTSFAPQKIYCPPSKPLDGHTTYHESYLKANQICHERAKSFKPITNLKTVNEKFEDCTTSKNSYKPVWNVVKANPIVPRQRNLFAFKGPMQSSTTVRNDFGPKFIEKPSLIIPCGNIRTSSGPLDGTTTAATCYVDPGRVRPPTSFKPSSQYCPPTESILNETTSKLSYQPYQIGEKEKYPWAQKPTYNPPEIAMVGTTTYSKSFFLNEQMPQKEKPIIPGVNRDIFPMGPMMGKSVYHDSYVPMPTEHVIPVIPCGNIILSDKKMTCDTTNQLSYKPIMVPKRALMRPKQKNLLNKGPLESATTNRCDYGPKMVPRPEVIIPCDNISNSKAPLEGSTTSGSSFINPGLILPTQSYKPHSQYAKPSINIDADTINKLSYKSWGIAPKEELPWAKKTAYKAPMVKMVGDSSYNMSYAAPGYYVEECEEVKCPATSCN